MIDLSTLRSYPLEAANSDDVESYHSWSSDSRWIVFSSRRMDGLYTRLFIAYIDERNGKACKPFLFFEGYGFLFSLYEILQYT